MRQLWMLIFVASLCDWVSGQARYTYYLERRPAGRPGNQRRPPEQSDQRPPDRDPDPTRWRSGNIEYVEKCTNGYMLDAFVANYHPTSPVFCADCVREDGTIKRRSCLDLNYCIGFHTRTETLIRQWNGGAFRTGDCYSVTLLPEPLNTEKKEYRIQCGFLLMMTAL
ncbi:hypothetical protein BDV26DRAFT_293546 [Aspergillus bertholletiae]|uniref:Cyanovirin-N domain-containing protein n=1 Tax=Aspergillus bertholletiae TaxID=1226010 RepID=A0A5N7B6Q4_9EURO|nr:hypothetical protein BDV26DRAFT_293546 [Aspergillus bertholletiae]